MNAPQEKIPVVLVEDDPALAEATAQALRLHGMEVSIISDAPSALAMLSADFAGVIVSDVRLPGMSGIDFAKELEAIDPDLPIIFITGHGDVEMAVTAMRRGAVDFLSKPFSTERLARSTRTAAEVRALVLENRLLRRELATRSDDDIIGTSDAAERLRSVVDALAQSDIDIQLEGAAGTGKNFIARLLHDRGPRRRANFVEIDAGIMAHEDAEVLLFGREPAAGLSRTGLIERAHRGTLLIDDIAQAESGLRSRLLSVLEHRTILPLGAERPRALDLRVIVAMRDRDQSDLLDYRLSPVKLELPRLIERRDDINDLFRAFVRKQARSLKLDAPAIGEAQWQFLQLHDWPGNLRELEGYARSFVLGLTGLQTSTGSNSVSRSLNEAVADFERALLEDGLRKHGGRVAAVADALRIPRKTLYDKLSRHGLEPSDFR